MIFKHVQQTDAIDTLLGEIANEFSERLADGESPSIDEYAEKYPQIAQMIREVFPALNLLRDNSTNGKGDVRPTTAAPLTSAPKSLGDFRILHELGRGGMGVVYEAEQLSMGRSVACFAGDSARNASPNQHRGTYR